jgi:hypothetical protein
MKVKRVPGKILACEFVPGTMLTYEGVIMVFISVMRHLKTVRYVVMTFYPCRNKVKIEKGEAIEWYDYSPLSVMQP